jgi:hypothetical protein
MGGIMKKVSWLDGKLETFFENLLFHLLGSYTDFEDFNTDLFDWAVIASVGS